MLVMNGHPVSSMAVPVYVRAKHKIPKCVSGSAMRDLSRDFKALAYTNVSKGVNYLNTFSEPVPAWFLQPSN